MVDRVLEPFARLLPYSGTVSPRRRRAAAAAAAVLLLSLAAHLTYTALGVGAGSAAVDTVVNRWGQQLVMGAAVALCALRVRRGDPDRATWLALTVPFPIYGIFRYLYLVHQKGVGSPSEVLLTDRPLVICIALWALAVVAIIYRPFGLSMMG